MLAQLDHGLARGVAVAVAGRLELAVVQAAPVAQQAEGLGRDAQPGAAQGARGQRGPDGRQHGRQRLAQQPRHLAEDEHAVGGAVVDALEVVAHRMLEAARQIVLVDELKARVEAEDRGHGGQAEELAERGPQRRAQAVGEAQHGDRDVRVAQGELAHGALGVDDVALDRRARRVRAVHGLGEEGRVVLLGPVVQGAGLEDDLADGVALSPARGQHVHRADDVVLVGQPRAGDDRVDHEARVDHGVDLGRLDDAADERVRVGHAHVLGAVQLDLRRAAVDADDRLHRRVALERLRQPAAPVRRQAGQQDPLGAHPNQTLRRSPSISTSSAWMVARISCATVCTSALSSHGSSPKAGSSVGTGRRKRTLNLAGR